MYRIPGVLSGSATPTSTVPQVRPTRLNDSIIRRLAAAGHDLQDALGLLGDHPASVQICHATEEIDRAIRDIRDAIAHPQNTA